MYTTKLKFTRLQNEIFSLLCLKAGKRLNQREIASILKVSPTAVSKSIKGMMHLIKINRHGNVNLKEIELDRDNPKAVALKRVENLRLIYESGLVECLEEAFPGALIIVFGSYSLGEDTVNSDIDFAIIASEQKDTDLSEFEKTLEKGINLNFFADLNKVDKSLRSNIINGIVLSGVIEL